MEKLTQILESMVGVTDTSQRVYNAIPASLADIHNIPVYLGYQCLCLFGGVLLLTGKDAALDSMCFQTLIVKIFS